MLSLIYLIQYFAQTVTNLLYMPHPHLLIRPHLSLDSFQKVGLLLGQLVEQLKKLAVGQSCYIMKMSDGILNRLEKSGNFIQNTRKFREFLSVFIFNLSLIFNWSVFVKQSFVFIKFINETLKKYWKMGKKYWKSPGKFVSPKMWEPCKVNHEVSWVMKWIAKWVANWVVKWVKSQNELQSESSRKMNCEVSLEVSQVTKWIVKWVMKWVKSQNELWSESWSESSRKINREVSQEVMNWVEKWVAKWIQIWSA